MNPLRRHRATGESRTKGFCFYRFEIFSVTQCLRGGCCSRRRIAARFTIPASINLTCVPLIAMLTSGFTEAFETLKRGFSLWSDSMAAINKDQEKDKDKANDKRATRRFALRLPVSVRYSEKEDEDAHDAQTRDVSARGICFYVDSAIQAGSAIDFTLTLPPEITLTESIRVRCKGRVVRVEGGSPAGKMAVAAVIDEYEFLSDSSSS